MIAKGSDLTDRMICVETEYDTVLDKVCQVNNLGETDMNRRLSILEQNVEASTAKIPSGKDGNKEF